MYYDPEEEVYISTGVDGEEYVVPEDAVVQENYDGTVTIEYVPEPIGEDSYFPIDFEEPIGEPIVEPINTDEFILITPPEPVGENSAPLLDVSPETQAVVEETCIAQSTVENIATTFVESVAEYQEADVPAAQDDFIVELQEAHEEHKEELIGGVEDLISELEALQESDQAIIEAAAEHVDEVIAQESSYVEITAAESTVAVIEAAQESLEEEREVAIEEGTWNQAAEEAFQEATEAFTATVEENQAVVEEVVAQQEAVEEYHEAAEQVVELEVERQEAIDAGEWTAKDEEVFEATTEELQEVVATFEEE